MLRNDIRAGLPVTQSHPIKVDPVAAAEWVRVNAPGARPGPGRPKKLPDFAKSQSPQQETARDKTAPKPSTGTKTGSKVTDTPRDVDGPIADRVFSGTASAKDLFKFCIETGTTAADIARWASLAKAVQEVQSARKASGQSIDVAATKAQWSRFLAVLARLLDALPVQAAQAVLAAAKLKPDAEEAIRLAIAEVVNDVRDQLIQGDDDGEATEDAGPGRVPARDAAREGTAEEQG